MPDRYIVIVPATAVWLNANDRYSHWSQRSEPTKAWRAAAKRRARRAKVPGLQRARITAVVHRPDDRTDVDAHNAYPTVKAAVDGLVDAGILPDDNDRHLEALTIAAGAPAGRRFPLGALELRITPLGDGDDHGDALGGHEGGPQVPEDDAAVRVKADHVDAR